MIDAIKIHGPILGTMMGLRRLSRCHPWGTHGYDPVPTKEEMRIKWEKLKLKKKSR
jgi:uncharacterized protein